MDAYNAMNVIFLDKPAADETDDTMGQLLHTACSVAEALKDAVKIENPERSANLDRIAHKAEIDMICRAMAQLQLVASNADIRRIALEQIAEEDAR